MQTAAVFDVLPRPAPTPTHRASVASGGLQWLAVVATLVLVLR